MITASLSMEYEKAIHYIFDLIQSKELTVGSKLPTERSIATTLDIGRNSTREALSILHGMGLVERIQGSGNYIAANSNETIRQILIAMLALGTVTKNDVCEFRRSMEKTVCHLLLEKGIPNEDHILLKDTLDAMEQAEETEQAALDKKFHELLMKATGNVLLITIMSAVMTVYREWIDDILKKTDPEEKENLQSFHKGILDGIQNGDAAKVEHCIDLHYKLIEELIDL